MLLSLFDRDRMSLLQNFMYCNKGLECLDLVCLNRLPDIRKTIGVSTDLRACRQSTHTFMLAQKEREDLWSHVYTIAARTCLPKDIEQFFCRGSDVVFTFGRGFLCNIIRCVSRVSQSDSG